MVVNSSRIEALVTAAGFRPRVSLLSIFASAILPIVAIAAAGAVVGRVHDVDPEALNTVTVYVLAPALAFHSLATTSLDGGTLLRVVAAVGVFHVVMIGVAEAVGRVLGESEALLNALVLVSAFPNSGNYGIPVSEFVFGQTGRSTAVLFMAMQGVLIYSVGAYVASRSAGDSGLRGVRRVFELPLVYAVAAALGLRWADAVPPADSTAMTTLDLLGTASIPLMLLILGIQLARTNYGRTIGSVSAATLLKMVVSPVVGAGVALLVGFADPTVGRVFVLETAMPAAVTPLILVIEFGGESVDGVDVAEFVGTAVLVTTLVSVPTVTLVVALLESGVVF